MLFWIFFRGICADIRYSWPETYPYYFFAICVHILCTFLDFFRAICVDIRAFLRQSSPFLGYTFDNFAHCDTDSGHGGFIHINI